MNPSNDSSPSPSGTQTFSLLIYLKRGRQSIRGPLRTLFSQRSGWTLLLALSLAMAGSLSLLIQAWLDRLPAKFALIGSAWYSLALGALFWSLILAARGSYRGARRCSRIATWLTGLSTGGALLLALLVPGMNEPIIFDVGVDNVNAQHFPPIYHPPVTGMVVAAIAFTLAAFVSAHAAYLLDESRDSDEAF